MHVWAGISWKGATGICIFEGTMDAKGYVQILQQTLLPFLHDMMPEGHHFMQDNNQSTHLAQRKTFAAESINCWKTPAKSPDLNPIENLWHKLKEYLRRGIEPQTKDQLRDDIQEFWTTVDIRKCQKYIGHLHKVIPSVMELKGDATGY